jgi:hypothetical protein
MSDKKIYEDFSDLINIAIKRQRSRWRLDAVKWFDFEDVEQVIKSHIYVKWHMWDQERPIEQWLNRVITNKMWNLIRNHYGSYVKPCVYCQYARDMNCLFTPSGSQDTTCAEYAKWAKKKKYGLELKTATSIEEAQIQVGSKMDDYIDYEHYFKKLDVFMKKKLSEQHYTAYKMIFFEKYTEEEVALFMGYKISASNAKLGYRQVKNLKRKFYEVAAGIIKEQDIFGHETDK